MALLCITFSGLSLSWHAQEEIKHFKINLSSYGYLALSPSLCKFWPVNSWVCQNGLTCIKRSVDHSLTMTAQFRFDGRNNHFYSFIRWPVSFGLRCLYLFAILNCQFFGRTEKVLFLKTELNITQFLCPAALKIGFLLLLPGKLQRKCRENL